MAVFTYKASHALTGEQTGTISADTPRQARDALRERGLLIRDMAEAGATSPRRSTPLRRRGASRVQVTAFFRELSTLLGAGLPLLESLETIAAQSSRRFQTRLLLLRERVIAGASLAAAMQQQPDLFDALAVNLTEVGEDSGTLDASLERLSEFRERSDQFRGRIGTALIYPAIVLTTATLASVFLMTFVVPRIIEPLIEQGQPLPFPTRVIKAGSDFLLAWWWAIIALLLAVFISFGAALRTARGRFAWQRLVMNLPVVGEIVRKQAILRICVVVSTLLKSGIVFVRAIEIAQRTTGNLVLREALARGERAINAGQEIAGALAATGAFPPTVVQIFSVGQQSGKLEEMLDRLAESYDQQVQTAAQRLAAILEPAIILLLAGLVLFIVLATVLPILEAGNAIQ
jgi:type II secretory pathway component PulF